jgi:2-oxoglutarate ferredoxin oxidoreductase subunit alpha
MGIDITVKIGGEAGQGIQTMGQLLALSCHRAGFYLMAINDFESRIRGGHSFFQVRISDQPARAPHHIVNLLVALNKETYDIHRRELSSGGLILMDESAGVSDTEGVLSVPFVDLAKKAGGVITSNTVAAGACLALLGAPLDLTKKVLSEQFGQKGEDVLNKNLSAAELGYSAVKDIPYQWSIAWKAGEQKGALIEGSKAIALGALAGDCRLGAFYPMSPATSIMTHLAAVAEHFPLVVEQGRNNGNTDCYC